MASKAEYFTIADVAPKGSYVIQINGEDARILIKPAELASYAKVQQLAALEGIDFHIKLVDEVTGKAARSNWLRIVSEAIRQRRGK